MGTKVLWFETLDINIKDNEKPKYISYNFDSRLNRTLLSEMANTKS